MSKRFLVGGLACTFGIGVALGAPTHAFADKEKEKATRCTTIMTGGTVHGDLVVPRGALCELHGTHVTGDATAEAGPPEPSSFPTALSLYGATIDGDVTAERNAQFFATTASTIGGSVECNRCEVADVQDSTVKGSLEDNKVSEGAFITNSHFGGDLQIENGTDFLGTGFHVDGNTVGKNLTFNENTGTSDISGNVITKNLQCDGNSPPPTGAGNTAKHKQGQCALL